VTKTGVDSHCILLQSKLSFCVNSLADRVLDFVLGIPWDAARSRIDVGDLSNNTVDSREPPCAARNSADNCGGEPPCRGLCNGISSSKEPIAVLHHVLGVRRGVGSIAVDQVARATVSRLDELQPVDEGRVPWIGAVSLENAHDMVGHVSDLDIL
jgi:hypothetical protein